MLLAFYVMIVKSKRSCPK